MFTVSFMPLYMFRGFKIAFFVLFSYVCLSTLIYKF